MSETRDELKPCPFCGATEDRTTELCDTAIVARKRGAGWLVRCARCGCEGQWASTPAKAYAAWNHRADDPRIAALEAALAESEARRERVKQERDDILENFNRLRASISGVKVYTFDHEDTPPAGGGTPDPDAE